MKKVIKAIIIIALIAAVGAGVYFVGIPMLTGDSGFNDKIAYVTKADSFNTENEFLSNRYSAVVESQEVVNVDSDAEKKIKTVFVKEGDEIKKGDKLFEYDADEMQFQLDQSKLDREQAQSEINSYNEQIASLEKEHANSTGNRRLSLENQIEATKLSLKKAEYNKEGLDKTITKIENSIKNAVVKSSVDGVIKTLDDPTAEAYITITSSGDLRIKATISEEHVSELYVDEAMIIRSRTDETVTWTGKIVSIDTAKPITNNMGMGLDTTTKYPVYISLDSADGLLIGQHVTIEENLGVDTDGKEGLWLSDAYIVDADSAPYVWTESGGALKKASVELGEYDETTFKYEIKSGLTGDDYIAFPEDRLYEGMETEHGFEEDAAVSIDTVPADELG